MGYTNPMRTAFAFSLVALTACNSTSVQRAGSPLIGTWQINAHIPPPAANLPRFTELTFDADGKLDASYVAAAGALTNVITPSSQIRREHDTYSLVGHSTLRVIEGSRALDYTYEVRDRKLFLTPPNGGDTLVYAQE